MNRKDVLWWIVTVFQVLLAVGLSKHGYSPVAIAFGILSLSVIEKEIQGTM